MINIVVSQNGNVSGDKGKIIAYEGQNYSEVINIIHPIFSNVKYYIEYKYDNTILRNELDANNQVSIKIMNAGYIKCQFIAVKMFTEDVVFKSKSWNLIIKEDLKIEESHYPCNVVGHHYKHRPPMIMAHPGYCRHNCNDNLDMYKKLSDEINNEEEIRFNEIQSIKEELADIKNILKINNSVSSILNANTIIIPGSYNAHSSSTGFPKDNTAYTLVVSYYGDNNILQLAYEKNSPDVYYRCTLNSNTSEPNWADWALLTLQS